MKLQSLESVLKKATPDVYELAAPEGAASFVVYARSGWKTVRANDMVIMELPIVQIDIVTQTVDASLEEKIFDALRQANLPYSVIDTGYNFERNWYVTRLTVVLPDG